MPEEINIDASFPDKLLFLFKSARYKVAHGGRGSGKSWAYARALLLQGIQKPLRVLCAREIQRSIKDSVHKLLSDQIQLMGLGKLYTVTETEIRGVNGTNFTFAGLGNQTVESIKSYEGVDICWVEEGQTISDRSWTILIPTIRKDNSEIWVSFNPDLDTDPTYQRFVLSPPDDALVVQVNYSDNPFFNEVMEKERRHCQKTDPVGYLNIWEGQCRPAVEGAIYHDQISAADSRICNVPYDPMLKVHVVMDLGWNDAMAISLVQRQSSEVRVIEYIEDSHRTLAEYSQELKDKRLSWGQMFLPHDGRAKDYKTGKSAYQILTSMGWDVKITENLSVEEGIRLARLMFPRVYFDKTKAARLVECLKRYRRRVNQATNEPGSPLHDGYCLAGDTLIRTLRGWIKIKDLVGEQFGVWSYSCSEHRLVPNNAVRCWESKTAHKIAVVVLDNGDTIECTPEHKFMMRNETWCRAADLKPWDSLMPFYEMDTAGHAKIHLNDGTIAIEHRYVYSRMVGQLVDDHHIHHEDSQKWNNEPWNLKQLSPAEHCSIHAREPERLAKLNKNKNTVCSEKSRQHLIDMNKDRAGDNHHTKNPAYWTDERRLKNSDGRKKYFRNTETEKACPSCNGTFIGNRKRLYCCDNCKAAALRENRGMQRSKKTHKHTEGCLLSTPNNHKVKSVDIVEKTMPVYDIEVEAHHNFVANGVVVHNSHGADCFRYIACNVEQMHNSAPKKKIVHVGHRPLDWAVGY